MPKLEQFEIKKYWQIFSGLKPVDNKLTHDQVQPILFNSKLDSSLLNKIWFLADIDDDDNLDFEEFVICMRLIFDMVNKNIDSVPDTLPDWLIPGSKAKLNQQRIPREASQESSAVAKPSSSRTDHQETPSSAPAPKLDWYISPSNKNLYAAIYESCDTLTDGTVTYGPLSSVARSKFPKISTAEFDRVWVLVNSQNASSINKDPAVYLLHALKQKNDLGCDLPTELPQAIRDICNQQRVTYDLNSHQGDVKRHSPQNYKNYTNSQDSSAKNTNNSEGDGTDSELSALRSQLGNLGGSPNKLELSYDTSKSDPSVASKQFEELYYYLQDQTSTTQRPSETLLDVRGVREDLETIEQQVGVLEQFLASKKEELQQLKSESQSLRI
ncbi:LADA_0E09164g1_1 [Lachancea dasiensis]|uniref:Actin cytoskeleton-regulatory complex protein END3 n=1 Tax=Lachancea dasiensis TaxID=1072105 RepID=A0A1G4JDJ0_9SACH|nr:LADA_0E09164g1_1 [Lachancea dasiensis]